MRGDDVRLRARSIALLACAFALGGCAQQLSSITEAKDTGWFAKPVDLFQKPEWAIVGSNTAELGPTGPVGAEELVSTDGQCAANAADAAAAHTAPVAAASAPASGGAFDGGLQTGPGGGPAAAPLVGGAIALGMTECQAVRRAGNPSHVAISANESGERRVVLTYLSGPWPGIYTFDAGRLKVVDAAPVQERKPEPKKKPVKRAKAVAQSPAPRAQ
jgi:hypothetical protein